MKPFHFSPLVVAAVLVTPSGCAAADHGFNAVVSSVEQHYSIHAQRVPMMGFVSFCARVATHGGVRGMRIAEFDNLDRDIDSGGLLDLVRRELGEEWQPVVTERSLRTAAATMIFVRPAGRSMRMLIADYEHGELDLVRMDLNGDALARFIRNPSEHPHRSRHGEYSAENAQ